MNLISIATRESQLALIQAQQVAADLQKLGYQTRIVGLTTTGDQRLEQPLTEIGGKGVFTKEIDLAVLDGRADISVHSLKDMPVDDDDGLILGAVPERESDCDIMVLSPDKFSYSEAEIVTASEALHADFCAGCGSPRRSAQLKNITGRLEPVRGNIQTRLRKMQENGWDGLVMAQAAYNRLKLTHSYARLDILPAAGQGAIGIRCLKGNTQMQQILSRIEHRHSRLRCEAEREFLRTLQGGCHIPAGIKTEICGGRISLQAGLFSTDGELVASAKLAGSEAEARELGRQIALAIKENT